MKTKNKTPTIKNRLKKKTNSSPNKLEKPNKNKWYTFYCELLFYFSGQALVYPVHPAHPVHLVHRVYHVHLESLFSSLICKTKQFDSTTFSHR